METAKKAAFGLIVAYLVLLTASFSSGRWLVDTQGKVAQTDFVSVWAAGRLVLEGHPADAYDWSIHKAIEEQAVGHSFDKYFGWHYPPTFLFIAAALAPLPYLPAFFAWTALTLPGYVTVIRMIVADRIGIPLACAFPAALWNVSVGQNGFLTAALLGGTLATMETRPVLAGLFLGLLSYKPHLGILFPLVIVVGGHWRVFVTATAVTLALIIASWLIFGTETWRAFFEYLPLTSTLVLGGGLAGFQKLQTIFGIVRWSGGSEFLAWALHGAIAVICTMFVLLIWRRSLPYEIKAAALSTAALTVTPYLYVYDMVALAVPMAFLVRAGLRHGFLPYEIPALTAASALLLATPALNVPLGPIAMLLVWTAICGRAFASAYPGNYAISKQA